MTKSQELAILDRAINELGPESYVGPWLAGVRDQVETEIRCDICPSPNIAVAQEQVNSMLAQARQEAQFIKEKRLKETKDEVAEIKCKLTGDLKQILRHWGELA